MAPLQVYSVLTVLLFCGCNNSNVATSTLPPMPPTNIMRDGELYQVGYFYGPASETDSAIRWVAFAKDVEGGDKWKLSSSDESLDIITGAGDSQLEAYEAMASKLQEHLRR